MTGEFDEPLEPIVSKADAIAQIDQAEAEAAEADALAAAARARARAARLRREALAIAEDAENYADAAAAAADVDAGSYYSRTGAQPHHELPAEDYEDYHEAAAEHYAAATAEPEFDPARRRRGLTALLVVAGILLICGLAGVSALMIAQHRGVVQNNKHQAKFVAGAKQGVLYMISLDYNKAHQNYQRMLDDSTGQFKDDFQDHQSDFISVVEQSKAVTEGTINAAAVESTDSDTDSAVVLVSATSRVTNSPPGKEEPPKSWRLRVTITDVGGHYKMSKVEYVT
jgi:Mce-associated membrane protein